MDSSTVLAIGALVGLGLVYLVIILIYRRSKAVKGVHYGRAQRIFGVIFILSSILFVLLVVYNLFFFSYSVSAPNPGGPPNAPAWDILAALPTLASCFASVVTLMGFVFSTVMGIRKDRRESRAADMDFQRQQIELERQKLELEKVKLEAKKGDLEK